MIDFSSDVERSSFKAVKAVKNSSVAAFNTSGAAGGMDMAP